MSDLINDSSEFRRGWTGGMPETPCGNGSRVSTTKIQRGYLLKIINQFNIKSIGDIGAGDLNWIKVTGIPETVDYIPYDIYPRLPEIKKLDILKNRPKKHDLLLCLWVLNHFSDEDVEKAVDNIKRSRAKYLLITQRPKYYRPDWDVLETVTINSKGDSILLVKL